ncbi:exodeoxyribonuclease V subunit beta [Pseudogulbenkiania subflava]|uniref:RecBCD enzyme subunit RecB n=1 Tax=Pseudogulbenkiania subflava DSM 22618 TaxID=1123014 RepID=A0A1Y6BA64_9NEIS|nr:exodeoxyribonuclease V subunit beta [Pseudogulbenkiania subflava]SMF00999.1 DNA helicase/exodeoxyribonuclease V, beta subunit [Pseudogulbenkiania subflava DSM 22618]
MTPHALDALHCELTGVNLIEASAGTGKTWTIAALYARLLLEERDGAPPPSIEQILVVTYTKAATAELRDRLRHRLAELAAVLDGTPTRDGFLTAMAQRFAEPAARELARQRLTAAITGFDAAAIYTIHGFCQRVLTDAAFESGQTFTAELIADDAERLTEVVDDFWRRRVVADVLLARVLAEAGETPDSWLAEVRPFLAKPYLHNLAPALTPLADSLAAADTAWQRLAGDTELVQGGLELLCATEGFKANIYGPAQQQTLVRRLQQWTADSGLPLLSSDDRKRLDKLTPPALAKGMKKGFAAPAHPLFDAVAVWLAVWDAHLANVAAHVAALKLELIAWVNAELARRRASERTRSFDDLLTDLAAALEHPDSGPLLAEHVARSFRVALIDEFQDTDPVQYSIFRACFVGRDCPLFLVGDPKQAIYSFRGADIFAYLSARADAARHYTLDTNRRSAEPLVAAVNALFAREKPFVLADIDYPPVHAAPSSGWQLDVDDGRAPLTFQWLDFSATAKGASKQVAMDTAAEASADEIARLLTLAGQGRARLVAEQRERPLVGGDIAVLVATHRQGERVRQALSERGVASVALTQESVFASAEAQDLLALLRAWAEPASEGRLRSALASELFGLDAAQLLARVDDEPAWEEQLAANAEDHRRWREHGFMAAWRGFFGRERLAERLLPLPDGERRLTNFAHLAELLQRESEERQGMAPLLAWFEGRVADPPGGEEALLRLESDAALVKIVTIHTSKGLQYPVVFCPFLWDGKLDAKETAFWRFRRDGTSWLAPDSVADDDVRLLARSETLAEKLRLLYVALTRAQYRQYLAWGWVQGMATAALSWLLHGRDARTLPELEQLALNSATLEADLASLSAAHSGEIGRLDASPLTLRLPPPEHADAALAAQPFTRKLYTPWRVASFTSLTASAHAAPVQAEAPDHDRGALALADDDSAAFDRFAFPRGARAGTCLHAMLERIDFAADDDTLRAAAVEQLERAGFALHWQEAALDMLRRTLAVPLDEGVCLADVPAGRRLVELEFTLPVDRLDVAALVGVLTDPANGLAKPLRDAAAALDFYRVVGYLKGFIDLVCEANGRWYLVDYKSNHLGHDAAAYHHDALLASVAREHYYLQYLLYCVALRRYLAARGIDFGARFGGVRYLYLRGLTSEGGGVWRDQPGERLIAQLDALFG